MSVSIMTELADYNLHTNPYILYFKLTIFYALVLNVSLTAPKHPRCNYQPTEMKREALLADLYV